MQRPPNEKIDDDEDNQDVEFQKDVLRPGEHNLLPTGLMSRGPQSIAQGDEGQDAAHAGADHEGKKLGAGSGTALIQGGKLVRDGVRGHRGHAVNQNIIKGVGHGAERAPPPSYVVEKQGAPLCG